MWCPSITSRNKNVKYSKAERNDRIRNNLHMDRKRSAMWCKTSLKNCPYRDTYLERRDIDCFECRWFLKAQSWSRQVMFFCGSTCPTVQNSLCNKFNDPWDPSLWKIKTHETFCRWACRQSHKLWDLDNNQNNQMKLLSICWPIKNLLFFNDNCLPA